MYSYTDEMERDSYLRGLRDALDIVNKIQTGSLLLARDRIQLLIENKTPREISLGPNSIMSQKDLIKHFQKTVANNNRTPKQQKAEANLRGAEQEYRDYLHSKMQTITKHEIEDKLSKARKTFENSFK